MEAFNSKFTCSVLAQAKFTAHIYLHLYKLLFRINLIRQTKHRSFPFSLFVIFCLSLTVSIGVILPLISMTQSFVGRVSCRWNLSRFTLLVCLCVQRCGLVTVGYFIFAVQHLFLLQPGLNSGNCTCNTTRSVDSHRYTSIILAVILE